MEPKATFTVEEASRILGIGRNSGYEAARRGEIPTLRIGKRVLVPRTALLRLLDEAQPNPASGITENE